MKLFKPLFYFTVVWSALKILISIFGIFNPYEVGNFIVQSSGVESLVGSESVGESMGKSAMFAIITNLVTSALNIFGAMLMNNRKRLGFYIYCFSGFVIAVVCFYSGINMFPSLEYIAVLPLIGVLAYTLVLDYFWDKNIA